MMSGQPGSPGRVFAAGGIQTMMDDYAQHHADSHPLLLRPTSWETIRITPYAWIRRCTAMR